MNMFRFTSRFMAAVSLLAFGALHQSPAQEQRGQPKDSIIVKGKLGQVDDQKRTVTLILTKFDRKAKEATETEEVFNVPKDSVILQDGVSTKLENLKRGFATTLKVNQKTALSITVEGPTRRAQIKSMNAERNTITVSDIGGRNMDHIYHLLKATKVITEGGKAGKVQDLKPGTEILLTLSVEGDNTVIRLEPPPMQKKRNER